MKKNKDLKKIIEKVISVFIIDYKGPYYEFESNDFDNEGFIEYDEDDSKTICNYYVKKQKFYLDDESKNILVKWTSRYYRILNMHLRQLINVSKEKEKEYEIFKKKLSKLIDSSEGLEDDVILYRGETNVDLSRFEIGKLNEFKGFISTSFSKKVGLKFSNFSENDYDYIIKIKAKRKTKGIAINGKEIGSYDYQSEWLLNNNTKYITKKIDIDNKMIYIDLI